MKAESKMVSITIPIDEKSKEKIMKIAARKAERKHSNPTAVIRDALLESFGFEQKTKPRSYMRKSTE